MAGFMPLSSIVGRGGRPGGIPDISTTNSQQAVRLGEMKSCLLHADRRKLIDHQLPNFLALGNRHPDTLLHLFCYLIGDGLKQGHDYALASFRVRKK